MEAQQLEKPTHLKGDVLHRLMRLFMEHKTDVLPVVERGRIVGQIDRQALYEALSEIRPEGYVLTVKHADSADALLRRLDASGHQNLATVNRQFEFNALWGRAEILQAEGKIPQVRVWTPPTSVEAAAPPAAVDEGAKPPHTPQAPRTISIIREQSAPEPATDVQVNHEETVEPTPPRSDRPIAQSLHRDIERGRLAINTLAALDLPLMACDGAGTELFHNRAYGDIKLRDALHLKSTEMVVRAKDAITESALAGDLDIDKAVALKDGPRGYKVFCKAIRDYDNPTARAVGYIFWLTSSASPPPSAPPLHAVERGIGGEAGEADYSGQTLPEILAAEEAKAMAWAMREAADNQSDAALLLGIPRQTFNYRYRRLMKKQR
ncbi:MAG: hypothetical protein JSR44_02445, partial [Spirochaetes bacterium]|nr:hypothetical protein [Spirochaetota bacterium]